MLARIERNTQQLKHLGPLITLEYILKLKEKRKEAKLALCVMNRFNIKLERVNWNNRTGPQSLSQMDKLGSLLFSDSLAP